MICLICINDVWRAWFESDPSKVGIGETPTDAVKDLARFGE